MLVAAGESPDRGVGGIAAEPQGLPQDAFLASIS
jgi:hypothetical protein